MNKIDIAAAVEKRMSSGSPFTVGELWTPFAQHRSPTLNPYLLAHKEVQRWRKRGWIAFRRNGREVIWTLTDAGRAALSGTSGEA